MSTVLTNNLTELATGDTVGAKYLVHGSAKAWANLNGTGTIALRDSFNVSSVTDGGVGQYTFTYTTAMANANYILTAQSGGANSVFAVTPQESTTPTASAFRQLHVAVAGSMADSLFAGAAVHGDLA